MNESKWGIAVAQAMLPPGAHKNIKRYFSLINDALDAQISEIGSAPQPSSSSVTPVGVRPTSPPDPAADALRLKLYSFATIAVENQRCSCEDEGISPLNTLGVHWKHHHNASPGAVPAVSLAIHEQLHAAALDPPQPFGLYDFRKNLGNHAKGMGALYRGRGFVQLTGFSNYKTYSRLAKVPHLVIHPELASKPANAARILAAYILHHRSRILAALHRRDFKAARQVVNGKRALAWDKMAASYQIGEKLLS